MKKFVAIVFLAVLAVGIGQANAYSVPDGWTSNPYYTHQTWSFSDSSTTPNADVGYTSPGTPTASLDQTSSSQINWLSSGAPYEFGYSGFWNASGPLTETVMGTFTLPQTAQSLTSQVQVNTIMQTNDMNFIQDLTCKVTSNGVVYTAEGNYTYDWINQPAGILELTLLFKDIPGFTNPITAELKVNNLPGTGLPATGYGFANFDYITIDTIPEPGAIAMLIAGGLSLLGWAGWRRRSK